MHYTMSAHKLASISFKIGFRSQSIMTYPPAAPALLVRGPQATSWFLMSVAFAVIQTRASQTCE